MYISDHIHDWTLKKKKTVVQIETFRSHQRCKVLVETHITTIAIQRRFWLWICLANTFIKNVHLEILFVCTQRAFFLEVSILSFWTERISMSRIYSNDKTRKYHIRNQFFSNNRISNHNSASNCVLHEMILSDYFMCCTIGFPEPISIVKWEYW